MSIIFPDKGHGQQLRMKRFLMAALSYLIFISLLFLCQRLDIFILSMKNTLMLTGVVIFINFCFFIIFRTGLNEKFKDKSLTMPQMSVGILVVMIVIYFIDQVRGAFLLLYIVTLSFGVFRLKTKQFLKITIFIIATYAFIVFLMVKLQPFRINPRVEIIRLVIISVVFTWFSVIGGYINKLHKKIEEMATIDELTKIFNRRKLFSILDREVEVSNRGGSPFCILMVDIDDFKRINDQYGHQIGDIVLKRVAQKMKENLRKCDYIGRYGGEEFLLILSYPTLDNALICSERLRCLIDNMEIETICGKIHVSISIGATIYNPGELIETTLSRADNALYKAKTTGKNRIEFERCKALEEKFKP